MNQYEKLERAAYAMADDIAFAREVHQHSVPHWPQAWPRINELSRKGLVRVTVLSRWMAEVEATGAALDGIEHKAITA